jgi:hypothetical protein
MLLCLCVTASGQEPEAGAEARAFLEMETPRETYFVQERVRLLLRVGFDRRYFDTNVVPMFSRPMDMKAQVRAPWLDGLPGTVALPEPSATESSRERLSFALNDEVVEAARAEVRLIDGRPFTVLLVERSFLPTRAGEIVIPAPTLRFAYATSFEEDFVSGKRPTDRRDAIVTGEPLTLRVRALPEEGRPAGFTGAVGRFEIEASAEPQELEAGESLKLTLRIEGDGNLGFFDTPRPLGLAGFHVYGAVDDRGSEVRTVTYDLAPIDERAGELPSIPFAYFDPRPPGRYRVVRTRPIPLIVRPAPGAARAPEPEAPEETEVPGGSSVVPLVVALLVVALCAAGLLVWRRTRARDRAEPDPLDAAEAFRTRSGDPDADLATAFAEYLSVRLRCPQAAVIAPDLAERLVAAGVPADLASRAATLLEGLVAARYGGGASAADARATSQAVVDELQASLGSEAEPT